MEKLNITDEEARLCRVEDALHDITQQLLASGLPLTQGCQPEVTRLLNRQETGSSIYLRFSAEDRMFGDDIATLRICTNPDFRRTAFDPEGNEYCVENLTFQVETRQVSRPAAMALQHAQQYLRVATLAAEFAQQFDGKTLYRLYQSETQNRGYAVNVYDDGSGAFIRRTR